jgi:hypothetical protein
MLAIITKGNNCTTEPLPKKLFDLPFPLASPEAIRTVSLLLLNLLGFRNGFTGLLGRSCYKANFTIIPLTSFGGCAIHWNAKFLLTLIFKNGCVGDITFNGKEEIITKSPLALFL